MALTGTEVTAYGSRGIASWAFVRDGALPLATAPVLDHKFEANKNGQSAPTDCPCLEFWLRGLRQQPLQPWQIAVSRCDEPLECDSLFLPVEPRAARIACDVRNQLLWQTQYVELEPGNEKKHHQPPTWLSVSGNVALFKLGTDCRAKNDDTDRRLD